MLFVRLPVKKGRSGFTLVEVVAVSAIISTLAGLSFSSAIVYLKNAYYSVAASLAPQVITAAIAAELDNNELRETSVIFSDQSGGALTGEQARMFSGLTLPPNVILASQYKGCLNSEIEKVFYLLPCKSDRLLFWAKFCNGKSVLTPQVEFPAEERQIICNS